MFSTADWHSRFIQQAQWTAQLRSYIYKLVAPRPDATILDVGCGTGALEPEYSSLTDAVITSLDIDLPRLVFAGENFSANWVNGDAQSLPFKQDFFDICLCHYLLLWINEPLKALEEMKRVTRPGGQILILAEPDYTHRIDFPDELSVLGKLQTESLGSQGADPGIGPSIAGLLNQADIEVLETGLSGGQWHPSASTFEIENEWKILKHDLSNILTPEQIKKYMAQDLAARVDGTRILFVPVFYAIGKIKPK
jgi:ubiquinone/menaquinone biosynthesis C-methylase UbiE